MAIVVKVERADDGLYWGYTDNIPGVVTASGATLEALKTNMTEAIELTFHTAEELNTDVYKELSEGYVLEYELELSTLFEKIEFLNKTAIAKRFNINPSLFRNYTNNKEIYISEERAKQIEKGFHELGQELMAIKL